MPANILTLKDIERIEAIPLEQHLSVSNTYEIIQQAAKQWSNKPAIIFLPSIDSIETAAIITYQQLMQDINRAANLFYKFGITRGKAVSYLLPNLPQTHYILWGAEAAGIANPINLMFPVEQIVHLLKLADCQLLITVGEKLDPDLWEKMQNVRKHFLHLKTLVIGGETKEEQGIYNFDELLAQQSAEWQHPRKIDAQDICAYFHSSGTTEAPKLAQLTHGAKAYMAWATNTCLEFNSEDVIANGLPMFHVGAPMVSGLAAFKAGATTILMSPLGWMDNKVVLNFWKIIKHYHITVTAALPFIYDLLLKMPFNYIDTRTLRLAISGMALSEATRKDLEDRTHAKAMEIYGLTEVTSLATFNPDSKQHCGSMGIRFPYEQTRVRKLDSQGMYSSDCKPNEEGVLFIKGPNVSKQYQDKSLNHDNFFESEWLNTKDLVRQDAQGYFWFVSRVCDLIHYKGQRIVTPEIEAVLQQHPQVLRAAMIGYDDFKEGEVPVAFVTLKTTEDITDNKILHWLSEKIPQTHLPTKIFIVDSLPLTGMGKVFKPALKDQAMQSQQLSIGKANA